jgi:hypothetical protein
MTPSMTHISVCLSHMSPYVSICLHMSPYVSLCLSVSLCVVERIEIDIEYHTMRTKGPLTAMRTIATEGMVGDPFHVCVGDTTVKCSSNRQCTSKGLTGGCQPHPAEASVMSMDLNKDGRVSYEELVESVNVNMKESFDMLDVAPNDGAITLVREICLYYTCWLYLLCNFQYRQHYENTCSYNFDC